MSKTYLFTPNSLKKDKPKNKRQPKLPKSYEELKKKYLKTLIRSSILYAVILVIDFFVFVNLFSNINNIWGFIKPKESTTVKEEKFKPRRPFLKADFEYTKEEKVNLSGRSEPGSTIVLFKDNNFYADTLADAEGKFFFNDVPIKAKEGSYTEFYAIAKSKEEVESSPSQTIKVFYDKTKPKLEVEKPKKDERIKSFSRTLEVKGKTEPEVKVTINGRIARINLNNEFSGTIRLDDGVNIIKVIAKDKAGNEAIAEVPVYFEKIR